MNTRPRLLHLDMMKGVAVLMVLVIHAVWKFKGGVPLEALTMAGQPCIGVFLFVTGYLAARSETGIVKRAWRLLPAYVFFSLLINLHSGAGIRLFAINLFEGIGI